MNSCEIPNGNSKGVTAVTSAAEETYYKKKMTCDFCGSNYETTRVRNGAKKILRTDTDFCSHYRGVNPDYYTVRVCPYCGYASTENFEEGFKLKLRQEFELKVASNWRYKDFGGERSWEEALMTFKLALHCAQVRNEGFRIISSLLHRIAWMYRYKGDEAQEKRWLGYALDKYMDWFSHEDLGDRQVKVFYLIAELNRRLGQFSEAGKWFAKVMNDPTMASKDPLIAKQAREQYAVLREEMKEAKE